MGNSRNTGYLGNVIKVSDTGNISFVSGSTVLMSVSSSGAVSSSATTVSSSIDDLIVNNNAVLGSSESSTVSIPAFIASDLYPIADTYKLGSPANYWTRAYVQTGSFNEVNVTGRITAQTLVVQTITSSVDFVTGSTRFGSLAANTHQFTGSILASGSVGIGTTSPTSKLHIINNTDGFVGRFTGGAASTVTAGVYANSTTGFASIGVQSAHQFRLFTNDADRLTVTSDGSVGIGTTNPGALLHLVLAGNSTRLRMEAAGSTYAALLDFTSGSTPRWSIGIDNTQAYGKLENRVLATDAIRFYDSSNNIVLVPTSGNVGVGTTSPTQKFHIMGSTGLPATSGTSQPGTLRLQLSGYGTVLDFGGEGPATGKQWIQVTDASNLGITYPLLLNPNGGLVGIGTTNPAGQLSGTIGLSIVNATNAALGLSNGTNHWLNYLSGTTYRIWNNSVSETMTILLNGNVGIGTVTPGFKLDISQGSPDVLRVINTGSATGNNPTAQFLNTHGNHSWGICAEFRVGASGGSDRASILFSHAYDTNTWGIGFGYNDSSYFRINKDQGPYGGGWGTTLFSLDRSGNYSFSGSNVSDRRNKKDITYITDSQLETISKLKPASFNKKSPGKEEYSSHIHTGFIAQDILEENIPNLVHGSEEDGYGLDYDGVLALTVKAIQELKAENDTLKEILQRNNIQ